MTLSDALVLAISGIFISIFIAYVAGAIWDMDHGGRDPKRKWWLP